MADEIEKPVVQCSGCGLLSLKEDKAGTHANVPVTAAQRQNKVVNLIGSGFTMRPYCCVNAYPLNKEFDDLTKTNPAHALNLTAFHEVIDKPRVCGSFAVWVPALTPKKHFDMTQAIMLREEIEKRRLADEAFRKEVRKADRDRDDKRKVLDDQFKREEMAFKSSERIERRYQ